MILDITKASDWYEYKNLYIKDWKFHQVLLHHWENTGIEEKIYQIENWQLVLESKNKKWND